jgi:hypothetical protein
MRTQNIKFSNALKLIASELQKIKKKADAEQLVISAIKNANF